MLAELTGDSARPVPSLLPALQKASKKSVFHLVFCPVLSLLSSFPHFSQLSIDIPSSFPVCSHMKKSRHDFPGPACIQQRHSASPASNQKHNKTALNFNVS